jgi:Uma2 family endonuclease
VLCPPIVFWLQVEIEVVSSNWEDDYVDQLAEYERAGVAEYWIVDFGVGESIVSSTFPGLQLTLNQVLDAADGEA